MADLTSIMGLIMSTPDSRKQLLKRLLQDPAVVKLIFDNDHLNVAVMDVLISDDSIKDHIIRQYIASALTGTSTGATQQSLQKKTGWAPVSQVKPSFVGDEDDVWDVQEPKRQEKRQTRQTDDDGWHESPEKIRKEKKKRRERTAEERAAYRAKLEAEWADCVGHEIPHSITVGMEKRSHCYGLSRTLRSEEVLEDLRSDEGWYYLCFMWATSEPDPERCDFDRYEYKSWPVIGHRAGTHILLRRNLFDDDEDGANVKDISYGSASEVEEN